MASQPPNPSKLPEENKRILITEFSESDASEIAELLEIVWPHAKGVPPIWRQKRCLTSSQVVEEMRAGYHYFGSRIDGRIVGFYKLFKTPEGLLGEHQTVHPDYRHRGLVRAMYRQFIDYAKEQGAPANLCNILVSEKNMCRLVESYGFQPYGAPYEQAPGMVVQLYRRLTKQ
ncbi:MAG: GNAT family N-acetyltransferase [Promethearchaeota archaeon]